MERNDSERWFVIEAPQPEIKSIVVGKYLGGFKIDIHGVEPSVHFDGGDTVQDRISQVIRILKRYVGPDARWVDCDTRAPIHVWDALAALSNLEEQ